MVHGNSSTEGKRDPLTNTNSTTNYGHRMSWVMSKRLRSSDSDPWFGVEETKRRNHRHWLYLLIY